MFLVPSSEVSGTAHCQRLGGQRVWLSITIPMFHTSWRVWEHHHQACFGLSLFPFLSVHPSACSVVSFSFSGSTGKTLLSSLWYLEWYSWPSAKQGNSYRTSCTSDPLLSSLSAPSHVSGLMTSPLLRWNHASLWVLDWVLHCNTLWLNRIYSNRSGWVHVPAVLASESFWSVHYSDSKQPS